MAYLSSPLLLQFADSVLDFSHLSLMLFIAFGWLMPRFRILHLAVVLVTGSSWLIFSNGNGIANCILTEWHYQILRKLGEARLPETYAQYVLQRMTGLTIQKNLAVLVTRSGWLISLIISLVLAYREHRHPGIIKCINSFSPRE